LLLLFLYRGGLSSGCDLWYDVVEVIE
jgi:hypothetical protein